ncbi:methyltransferase family protein [Humitalea rosea]|uniref:Methyltransferase family protein n=1 Tax=Humitalea rosea TaxID=990373 RepID=A0A2W7IMG9_9PROT|nr:class I SAM-dependent methyltransferase [Humitalea rosea]PZW47035.1 methyltransferase family protein [Humitalea rosea]
MSDAGAWDRRYAVPEFLFGTEPNLYLRSLTHRLRPGMRALAIGDGEGRNAAWLAGLGLEVTAVDWSAEGQAKAAALAASRGVAPRFVQADLTLWDWPVGAFDLLAWVFVHLPPADRAVAAAGAAAALAPGGLLALEGFSPAGTGRRAGGPKDASLLWTRAEVERLFPGLEVLELLEGAVLLDEGPKHQGLAEVVRALLRRPG